MPVRLLVCLSALSCLSCLSPSCLSVSLDLSALSVNTYIFQHCHYYNLQSNNKESFCLSRSVCLSCVCTIHLSVCLSKSVCVSCSCLSVCWWSVSLRTPNSNSKSQLLHGRILPPVQLTSNTSSDGCSPCLN